MLMRTCKKIVLNKKRGGISFDKLKIAVLRSLAFVLVYISSHVNVNENQQDNFGTRYDS